MRSFEAPVDVLGTVLNEVTIQRKLADQRIDLPQIQRQVRTAKVAAYEVVFTQTCFQSHGAYRYTGLSEGSYGSGVRTPSSRLSSTTTRALTAVRR
jgi:hypothetical protein